MASTNDADQMPPPPALSSTPAADNPRPILKLNTASRALSFSGDSAMATPSSEKKIKIKISSQPNTPAATTAAQTPTILKTKAGRTSKPTAKLSESKKRGHDSDDDKPLSTSRTESARPSKTIKLTHKPRSIPPTPSVATPINAIRFKPKGEAIVRKPGDAYDSEAEDRETDPQRETNFVLRVLGDEPSQYLKKALADGTIGQPKLNGGADFSVQFVDGKERRAMVTVNGIHYAAVLVQLPTITEAMKTWDRKALMKNSDVTEMLICYAVVKNEQEARAAPLPSMVTKNDLKWPHGITPPMHDAPNRRFRKTLSEKQWERTQDIVAKLLADDAAADEVRTELIIDDDGDAEYDDDEDAEGELEGDDYFGDHTGEQDDMDVDNEASGDDMELEAELEREFMAQDEPAATPGTQLEAPTPMTMGANTPIPPQETQASEDEGEEEEEEEISDEDDDDDEDADDEDRAEDQERRQQLKQLQELQKQLDDNQKSLENAQMPIIRKRLMTSIESIKKEIAVKKAALNLTDED